MPYDTDLPDVADVNADLERTIQNFDNLGRSASRAAEQTQSSWKKLATTARELAPLALFFSSVTGPGAMVASSMHERGGLASGIGGGATALRTETLFARGATAGLQGISKRFDAMARGAQKSTVAMDKLAKATQKLSQFTKGFAWTVKDVEKASARWIASNSKLVASMGLAGRTIGKVFLGPVGTAIAVVDGSYQLFIKKAIKASDDLIAKQQELAKVFASTAGQVGPIFQTRGRALGDVALAMGALRGSGFGRAAALQALQVTANRGLGADMSQQIVAIARSFARETGREFDTVLRTMSQRAQMVQAFVPKGRQQQVLDRWRIEAGPLMMAQPGFGASARNWFQDVGGGFARAQRSFGDFSQALGAALAGPEYQFYRSPLTMRLAQMMPGRRIPSLGGMAWQGLRQFGGPGPMGMLSKSIQDIEWLANAAGEGGDAELRKRIARGVQGTGTTIFGQVPWLGTAVENVAGWRPFGQGGLGGIGGLIGGIAPVMSGWQPLRGLFGADERALRAQRLRALRENLRYTGDTFTRKGVSQLEQVGIDEEKLRRQRLALQFMQEKKKTPQDIEKRLEKLRARQNELVTKKMGEPGAAEELKNITGEIAELEGVYKVIGTLRIKDIGQVPDNLKSIQAQIAGLEDRRKAARALISSGAAAQFAQQTAAVSRRLGLKPGEAIGFDQAERLYKQQRQEMDRQQAIIMDLSNQQNLRELTKPEEDRLRAARDYVSGTRMHWMGGDEEYQKVRDLEKQYAEAKTPEEREKIGKQLATAIEKAKGPLDLIKRRTQSEVAKISAAYKPMFEKLELNQLVANIQAAVIEGALSPEKAKELVEEAKKDTAGGKFKAGTELQYGKAKKQIEDFQKMMVWESLTVQFNKKAATQMIKSGEMQGVLKPAEAQFYGRFAGSEDKITQQALDRVLKLKKAAFDRELAFTQQYAAMRMNIIREHYTSAIQMERGRLDQIGRQDVNRLNYMQQFAGTQGQLTNVGQTTRGIQFAQQQQNISDAQFRQQQMTQLMGIAGMQVPRGLQMMLGLQNMAIAARTRRQQRREQSLQDVEALGEFSTVMDQAAGLGLDITRLGQSEQGRQFYVQQLQRAKPAFVRSGQAGYVDAELKRTLRGSQRYQLQQMKGAEEERGIMARGIDQELAELEKTFQEQGYGTGPEARHEYMMMRARKLQEKSTLALERGDVKTAEAARKEYMDIFKELPTKFKDAFKSEQALLKLEIQKSNEFLKNLDANVAAISGKKPVKGQTGQAESTGQQRQRLQVPHPAAVQRAKTAAQSKIAPAKAITTREAERARRTIAGTGGSMAIPKGAAEAIEQKSLFEAGGGGFNVVDMSYMDRLPTGVGEDLSPVDVGALSRIPEDMPQGKSYAVRLYDELGKMRAEIADDMSPMGKARMMGIDAARNRMIREGIIAKPTLGPIQEQWAGGYGGRGRMLEALRKRVGTSTPPTRTEGIQGALNRVAKDQAREASTKATLAKEYGSPPPLNTYEQSLIDKLMPDQSFVDEMAAIERSKYGADLYAAAAGSPVMAASAAGTKPQGPTRQQILEGPMDTATKSALSAAKDVMKYGTTGPDVPEGGIDHLTKAMTKSGDGGGDILGELKIHSTYLSKIASEGTKFEITVKPGETKKGSTGGGGNY